MIRTATAAAVAAASLLTITGLGCAAHSSGERSVRSRFDRCLAQYGADICGDLAPRSFSTGAPGAVLP